MRRRASLVALLFCSAPSAARASDKFDTTLDLSFHATFSVLDVQGVALSSAAQEPSLAGLSPELRGRSTFAGFRQHAGLNLRGLRLGVGVGALAAPGLRVQHQRPGLDLSARDAWAMPLEAYLAFAPGDPRYFRPYGGVQAAATLVSVSLSEHSPGAPYRGFAYGGSVRAGVVLQLNQFFYADLGGSLGVVGADVFQVSAALGLPIPLANL